MRHVTLAKAVLIAATVSALWLADASVAQVLRRDREGPSANRVKIVNMLTEARRLAGDAATRRKEAVEGRIPDRSKSRRESREERWIELSNADRLKRFGQARSKYLSAVAKAAEAEAFLKKHPGVALDEAPTAARGRLSEQYALTLVAECRFRMAENLGTPRDWRKLASLALKVDSDSAEAKQLIEDIKAKEEEIKKAEQEKREEAKRKREEQEKDKKESSQDDAKDDDTSD